MRMKGKIDIDELTVSQRLNFEFGQIQRAAYNQNWHLNITTMPRTNVKAFTQMPEPIKNQIMILFEASTKFTCTWHKYSFPNPERNTQCVGYLNSKLGFSQSKSLFEYFDIVISRNTILRKHCDVKNCHRPGYSIYCVYSYYTHFGGDEYKVYIIMTARTTVGSAFEKANNNI